VVSTAPVGVGGLVGVHTVPTTAQASVTGQAMAKASSIPGGAVRACHVLPSSVLTSSAPWAGATSVRVLERVPTATQSAGDGHATPCSSPVPAGTAPADQVVPPSSVTATAPDPFPGFTDVYPALMQTSPSTHVTLLAPANPGGSEPWRCHTFPPSVVAADQ
jgi:hypothetical protein